MPPHKRLDIRLRRRLADHLRHIQREEVAWRHEPIHRLQVDVVRIQKVRLRPAAAPSPPHPPQPASALGSEPMIMCSRLDLFHTGTTSTPASPAITHAASCAFAWCANRSPTPTENLGSFSPFAHTFKHPKINRLIGRTTSAVQHTHLTTNPQTPGSRRRPLSSRSGLGTTKVPAQDSRCKRSPRHPPRSTRPSTTPACTAPSPPPRSPYSYARTLDLLPRQVPGRVPYPKPSLARSMDQVRRRTQISRQLRIILHRRQRLRRPAVPMPPDQCVDRRVLAKLMHARRQHHQLRLHPPSPSASGTRSCCPATCS